MKNYDKNIKSSYTEYLDANNWYRWAMSQKLPVDGFKQVEKKKDLSRLNESFIKNYNESSDKGHFLEVDVKCPKILFNGVALNLHKDLPFLPERKKNGKSPKACFYIEDREKYDVHIRALNKH